MTKHVMSNVIVTASEEGRTEGVTAKTATSRSYDTVFQAVPGELALQPIIAGRYRHRFELIHGQWHITRFHVIVDLLGELESHLRSNLS